VQATDGGGTVGLAQTGDVVTFTYAGTVDPDLILSGWDGSATGVTVRISGNGPNDALAVHDASDDSVLAGLGTIDLNGNHANGTSMDFTGSQMTLSGNTVTIVLGAPVGNAHRDTTAKAMTWSTPQGTTTESGALDADF
jgi:beta-glucanase (GH16 family)